MVDIKYDISDYMTKNVSTLSPSAKVREVAEVMTREDIGSIVVTEDERVVGIVTERDLVKRCLAKTMDLNTTKLSNIMSKPVITADINKHVMYDVAELMKKNKIKHIPIMDGDKLVGIITTDNIANNLEDFGFLVASRSSRIISYFKEIMEK